MAQESGLPRWDVLAAELRAFRDQQKQTWGDVDSALIGRYLAGEATAEDRRRVEAAFDEHPDLRVLTELVSDVLNEFEPLIAPPPLPPPVQQPELTQPRLLPFTQQPKVRRSFLTRVRRYGALAAAACLLLALGVGLGGQSLPTSDTTAGRGWEDVRAERGRGTDEALVTARDVHPEPASSGVTGNPTGLKADSPSAHSLAQLTTKLEKARQRRSEESINEVALGVETYLAKASPYFYTNPADAQAKILPAPPPGGNGEVGVPFHNPVAKDKPLRPDEVLAASARLLAEGLEHETTPDVQQRYCDTLARMGPYAVPALEHSVKHARNLRQQQAAVSVLKQMGPAARKAAPTLEWLVGNGPVPVRGEAEEALRCIAVCADGAGVNDIGQVLAEPSRRHLNQRIQTLCRKHHFHFVAETIASLPDDRKRSIPVVEDRKRDRAVAQWSKQRSQQVGAENGLYLLICQDPPTVQIVLGEGARTRVRPQMTEQLNRWLQIHLRDKDRGLEKAVNLVEHELSRSR